MRKKLLTAGALFFAIAGAVICISIFRSSDADAQTVPQNDMAVSAKADEEGMKWYSVTEALELNKQTHKKIFIDVYAQWCGPCKWLAANTFTNPVIQEDLNKYYIPAKFDAESSDTIFFQGKRFINQNPNAGPRMSTHDFTMYIAQTQQGIAYPTLVFLDEDLNMIQPIPGALTAEQLEPILDFIGNDMYKTTPWDEYMKTYHSRLTATGK